MGWYRRSTRFISDAFRRHTSAPRIPLHESPSLSSSSAPRISQPILSLRHSLAQNQRKSPLIDGAKRFYYVDRNKVHHFKPRGYKRWSQNPRILFSMVLVGSGVVITVYFGNLETVPYTKRTHFVLLSSSLEKQLGESNFKTVISQYKGKIVPPLHPESIRVQKIAQDIVEAVQKGLRKEQVWTDLGYSSESLEPPQNAHKPEEAVGAFGADEDRWIAEDKWRKEDEILDDGWVQQSRKKGQEVGAKSQTSHLEGFKWEVILVNDPTVNALCLPGGKIVVFTGLLNHFRADAEIATIIGHEVAHVVARHAAENISKNVWLTIMQLILYQFFMPDVVNTMSNLFLRLPFSRRMELEADYIGVLLSASAGYDPRVAPQVYDKLQQVGGSSALHDYLATHPSGKKRAKLLSEAKVMEEALSIYREVQAGRGVKGFL
ncbi:metalloendopeptidase OMA1, mitochondrial-like [Salvia hispanica]|uniref:metalloendopeptidase OMA1, mitochondrial-like n=1 Tax=Salvia hispanica TaxID=49212 RepID=UPI00200901A7|nr:metalloendopeptidase OMA1, mitochondrial-like [Salvia hispanica]